VKKELEENGHYVKWRKKKNTTESNIIKRKKHKREQTEEK